MKNTIVLLVLIIVLSTGCQQSESPSDFDIAIREIETEIQELNSIINELKLINESYEGTIQKLKASNEELTNRLVLLESENEEYYCMINSMLDTVRSKDSYITHFSECEEVIGIIVHYDLDNNILYYDKIEWIGMGDINRINELELNINDDFPNPYYIYNEEVKNESIELSDETSLYILDGTRLQSASRDELVYRINEYEVICKIIIINDQVLEVSEIYRP